METKHAVQKAKKKIKKTKERRSYGSWVIENAPKAGKGHGRNSARFALEVTFITACGGN